MEYGGGNQTAGILQTSRVHCSVCFYSSVVRAVVVLLTVCNHNSPHIPPPPPQITSTDTLGNCSSALQWFKKKIKEFKRKTTKINGLNKAHRVASFPLSTVCVCGGGGGNL